MHKLQSKKLCPASNVRATLAKVFAIFNNRGLYASPSRQPITEGMGKGWKRKEEREGVERGEKRRGGKEKELQEFAAVGAAACKCINIDDDRRR